MLSLSSGAGRFTGRCALVVRVLLTLLTLAILAAPLMAQEQAGGEVNLKLPDLNQATFLGGILALQAQSPSPEEQHRRAVRGLVAILRRARSVEDGGAQVDVARVAREHVPRRRARHEDESEDGDRRPSGIRHD